MRADDDMRGGNVFSSIERVFDTISLGQSVSSYGLQ